MSYRSRFVAGAMLLAAGSLGAPAHAAWEPYDDTPASTAFFDPDFVARDGDLVKLTVHHVYKKTMNTSDGMSYVESEYVLALDCSTLKSAVTQLQHLAKIRGNLRPIAEETYPREKWDFAAPAEGKSTEFFQSICQKMRPAAAVAAAAIPAAPLAPAGAAPVAAPVAIESVPLVREAGQAPDGLYYKALVWGMTEEELLKSHPVFRCKASTSAPGDRQCEVTAAACPPMVRGCNEELEYADALLNTVTAYFFGNRLVSIGLAVADHNVARVKQWLAKTYGAPASSGPAASDAKVEVQTWERGNAILQLSTQGTREANIRVASKAGEHELAARNARAAAALAAARAELGTATLLFVREKNNASSAVAYDVMSGASEKLGTLPPNGGSFSASVPTGSLELWGSAVSSSGAPVTTSKLTIDAAANGTYYVALQQGLFSNGFKQVEKAVAEQLIADLTAAPALAAAEPAPAPTPTSEAAPTDTAEPATDSVGSSIAKAFSFLPAIVGAATAVAGLRYGDTQVATSGAQLLAGATLDPSNMNTHIDQFINQSQGNLDRLKAQQQALGAGSGAAVASASGGDVGNRCAQIATGRYPENTQNRLQMRAGCIYWCAYSKTQNAMYLQKFNESQRNANSLCSAGMGNCNTINTGACTF